jgi:hypothetical protein
MTYSLRSAPSKAVCQFDDNIGCVLMSMVASNLPKVFLHQILVRTKAADRHERSGAWTHIYRG